MNKAELIETVAEKSEVSKKAAGKMLDAFMETVSEQLQKGNDISLVGFGTFKKVLRKARTGNNPKTKEKIEIAAKNKATFKAGKTLENSLN